MVTATVSMLLLLFVMYLAKNYQKSNDNEKAIRTEKYADKRNRNHRVSSLIPSDIEGQSLFIDNGIGIVSPKKSALRSSEMKNVIPDNLIINHGNNWLGVNMTKRNATTNHRKLARPNQHTPCIGNTLLPTNRLPQPKRLCSPSLTYRFGYSRITKTIIIRNTITRKTIWEAPIETKYSTTTISAKTFFEMKTNGNAIFFDPLSSSSQSSVIWSSDTETKKGDDATTTTTTLNSRLVLSDDGQLRIVTPLGTTIWSVPPPPAVDSNTLDSKIMAGYQGWFSTPRDGGKNRWRHWTSSSVPSADTVTVDGWPDLREFEDENLATTNFVYPGGRRARLFSSSDETIVTAHCRWMAEYGIDGVFVQRFLSDIESENGRNVRDGVLESVRRGAESYGRVFANMYDVSGAKENEGSSSLYDVIRNDWRHLVDALKITDSGRYLYHRGRPVLAVWGFGFEGRPGEAAEVLELIKWLTVDAEERYRVTLIGGVPSRWRELDGDSKEGEEWAEVYRSFDVVSPWTVGRYTDDHEADVYAREYVVPDKEECWKYGIDYMPVVFPGYSFHNVNPSKPFNEIPRRGGTFLWRQLYNAIDAGNSMIYVAMFDEVDEGTAIFKVAENKNQVPTTGKFLTLDLDEGYDNIPSDWYMKLVGSATKLLRSAGMSYITVVDDIKRRGITESKYESGVVRHRHHHKDTYEKLREV